MKKLILILLFLNLVGASCIDINTASLEKLDEITYVGPATAQKIVDSRPFESIDELIKVSGVGETKLAAIKNEGKACVEGASEEKEEGDKKEKEELVEPEEIEMGTENIPEKIINNEKIILGKTLDSKDIKKGKNTQIIEDKKTNSPYLLVGFCVLLGFLFFIKEIKEKRNYKNEFRKFD